ncbi:KdsC family phosphatase [Halomonas binhaiensis]|uniref:3-deoxy-D-manno-octulosonate 8-phosphate phosphatase KdsC n=1 Tax=Halomonas binhaiensis TaxID=2562282 RepID=A0A5C1NDE1_9GAMM|nr:HAD hydrolase family protein [Halomonas binhaiensis]QEM81316.1 HAD hydrolase family protein [Halomonas binhaiensis]
MPKDTLSTVPQDLLDRLRRIRLLALDVDGVMTDGSLYFQADGSELKAFNTLDGHGLKLLKRAGIEVAIITGRRSTMVEHRADALGIRHVSQGVEKKLVELKTLCTALGLELHQVAYCGDDLPDLPCIHHVGVGISVPGAPDYIQKHAHWVTERHGGHGAVREICDRLLMAQGHWDSVLDTYLHSGH